MAAGLLLPIRYSGCRAYSIALRPKGGGAAARRALPYSCARVQRDHGARRWDVAEEAYRLYAYSGCVFRRFGASYRRQAAQRKRRVQDLAKNGTESRG